MIEQSVKRLFPGVRSEHAIKELLLERAQKNLIRYQLMVRKFELKYSVNFELFRQKILSSKPEFEIEQDYFDYGVTFVVERSDDAANHMVDTLIRRYSHARKVISGAAEKCAQKNYNLVCGLQNISAHADIIVFYDSTNESPRHWLRKFTEKVITGEYDVVTTFRAFEPQPQSLGAICQALYGECIFHLNAMRPTPWGGATAIKLNVFEKLNLP